MTKRIDWNHLRGKTFKTINGASFTVTNVTRKNVVIRPKHGRRDYDLSIATELERGLGALLAGDYFPTPTELLRIGVRHERNSYVWGVLKAVWKELLSKPASTVRAQDFVGNWQVVEFADLARDYLEKSDEAAYITIKRPTYGSWDGRYHFGLCDGEITGAIREFGGELLLIFSFEGSDEMDLVTGGGWARLNERGEPEGEFLGYYGEFKAVRPSRKNNDK
jgi:hypothetical protein